MKPFYNLPINRNIVSIFATGESSRKLTVPEYNDILQRTYTIGINKFDSCRVDARIWYDAAFTSYAIRNRQDMISDCDIITRIKAYNKLLGPDVYLFEQTDETSKSNVTMIILIKLLKKYFPDKKILLFGVDCHGECYLRPGESLSYIEDRRVRDTYGTYLNNTKTELEILYNTGALDNVFLCSQGSSVKMPILSVSEVLQ